MFIRRRKTSAKERGEFFLRKRAGKEGRKGTYDEHDHRLGSSAEGGTQKEDGTGKQPEKNRKIKN